jgi:hypothetical protein
MPAGTPAELSAKARGPANHSGSGPHDMGRYGDWNPAEKAGYWTLTSGCDRFFQGLRTPSIADVRTKLQSCKHHIGSYILSERMKDEAKEKKPKWDIIPILKLTYLTRKLAIAVQEWSNKSWETIV